MKMIDKEYENFSYSGDRWFPFQSKLTEYRKEIEAQAQAEINTKVYFLQWMKSYMKYSWMCYVSCFIIYE